MQSVENPYLARQLSMFYHRQPATGVPGAVICSEGYRRMQELGGKRRETTIYTGSARRKVTAPYVQCGVDSILRPALFVVVVSSVGYVCRPCVCVS